MKIDITDFLYLIGIALLSYGTYIINPRFLFIKWGFVFIAAGFIARGSDS